MKDQDNPPPGITERYGVATQTSDLTVSGVDGARGGAGDMMIAAGWSPSRLGTALMRLHGEWDSAAKPPKVTATLVRALSLTVRDARGRPDTVRARQIAARWYANELRILALGLRSRRTVIEELNAWGAIKGIAPSVISAAVHHWLNHVCPVCDGHGLRRVPDQPALSARRCHDCRGTGEVTEPAGVARVIGYVEYCTNAAGSSLCVRLRGR
jgi:hypothetical protein